MKKALLLLTSALVLGSAVWAQRTKTNRRTDSTGTGTHRNSRDSSGHYKNNKYNNNNNTDSSMRSNRP